MQLMARRQAFAAEHSWARRAADITAAIAAAKTTRPPVTGDRLGDRGWARLACRHLLRRRKTRRSTGNLSAAPLRNCLNRYVASKRSRAGTPSAKLRSG